MTTSTDPAQTTGQDQENITGVFSITKKQKIGTGTTARYVQQQSMHFVEQGDDGKLTIQPLGPDNMPFGPKKVIARDTLLKDYIPEPAVFQKKVLPGMRNVQKAIARGDKFRRRGETFTAEFEYAKALQFDDKNVRANFGIGMCYIQRGEQAKAKEVFDRVIKLDAAFSAEHKHLFNEFGMNLRKSGMLDEALEYYSRALQFDADDENLHYNLARAFLEKRQFSEAAAELAVCVKLNPEFKQARQVLAKMQSKGLA